MSVEPVWFGTRERPLLGFVHRPDDGRARGGVVLCPPVGIELSYTHSAYRRLAHELESTGLVVARFDYDGTGQSVGDMDDPDRVSAWVSSIGSAVELVRECGVAWLAGVGLRLGAALLARAAETLELDALVLWDPCLSGKTFLREQRALHLSVIGEGRDVAVKTVELPGYAVSPETAESIATLEISGWTAAPSPHVLALLDSTRPVTRTLARVLELPQVERVEQIADASIFDIGQVVYEQPSEPAWQIVRWLSERCRQPRTPLRPLSGGSSDAVVTRFDAGRCVVERPVRLGSTGLFGIHCAADGSTGERPTVMLLSIAAESSIGPARLWVELARRLAAEGYDSVRFDFSGVGESRTRAGRSERHLYAAHAIDDIREAAEGASPRDPSNVVLVGVCSGAYAALAAAPQLLPRGVVAINPILTQAPIDCVTRPTPPRPPSSHSYPHEPRKRLRRAVADNVPSAIWPVLYGLGLAHSPARLLDPITAARVPTLLLAGAGESEVPAQRTPRAIRRFERDGGSRFRVVPSLHHSLLDVQSRALVEAELFAFLARLDTEAAPIRSRTELAAET